MSGTGGAGTGGVGGGVGGRGGAGGLSTGSGGAPSDGGVSDGTRDGTSDGGPAYAPCPATAGTACTILPLGDSITEGCCTAPEGGYRIELFHQAVLNGKNLTFVGTLLNGPATVQNRTFPMRHEGHGGFTIAGGGVGPLAGSVTDTAISTYHPNIVLLMIGTNDINGNIDVANAPQRLGQLIDEITTDAPAALVVVATIIPIAVPNADQRTRAYNAAIPGLVSARASAGKHVVLLDNYAAFSKDPNYQTTLKADGLHPNDAGYVVLGQSFYGAIAALLP
jgi:lysophospholipase L1-like esterase